MGADNGPDLSGQTIGEYEITSRLGVGGMGVVYEGKHPLIGKRVAVKVLLPQLSNEQELVDRFLAEARAVNEIRHRGIVDIFSFGKLPSGSHYFVMEYLQGEPFDRLIKRRGALPIGEALGWVDEVLDALEAAHSAGIIHRDIKPSNLFLVDTGRGRPYVKLLDFGIAKLGVLEGEQTPQTRASVIVGTPDYISPEQARGKPISPRTDLYALGVVLFELVTGRRPFKGENSLQTMWMHVEAQPPRASEWNADVPPELDELIHWALEKEQEARPPSAAVMREHLSAIRATLLGERAATPVSGQYNTLGTPPPISSRGLPRPPTPAPVSGKQRPVAGKTPPPKSGRQSSVRPSAPPAPGGTGNQTRLAPLTAEQPVPTMPPPRPSRSAMPVDLERTDPEQRAPDVSKPTEAALDQVEEQEVVAPPKSMVPFVALGAVAVVLLAVGGVVLFGGGSGEAGAGPDAVKPDAVKPDAVKPDAVKPDVVKPDAVKPDVVKPDAVKPDAVKPDAVKPDAVKPDAVKPDAVKPDAVKPDAVKPDAVKPDAVKPDAVKPDAVKPVRRGPSAAQLQARLTKLEMKLAAKEAQMGDQDRVLRQFMAQARKDVASASTDQERIVAGKLLDEIAAQLR